MTRAEGILRRAAFAGLGIAFSGGLYKLLRLDPAMGISLHQDIYEFSQVAAFIHSSAWRFGGLMHLLAAVALALLAVTAGHTRDLGNGLVRVSAVLGSGCFLLLGLGNLIGVPSIEAAGEVCGGDGRAALVVYNVGRAVLLSASMLVLGVFLLIHNGHEIRFANGHRLLAIFGMFAGIFCVGFVLAGEAPGWFSLVAVAAVALWGWGFALVKPGGQ